MTHREHVGYHKDPAKLGQELADSDYDYMVGVLSSFSRKVTRDGEKDYSDGRNNLAHALFEGSDAGKTLAEKMKVVADICRPHNERSRREKK